MARELVTKENSLVAASYSLDLIEQRLILLSIALSRRTGLGLSAQKPLFITAQEFSSAYGSDVKNAYRQLKSATETLFDRQITYKDVVNGTRGVSRIRWVQKIFYSDSEGAAAIQFSEEVIPLFKELEKNFTSYYLDEIRNLSSTYAIRLFELCSRWKNAGKTPYFTVEELKEQIGVVADSYQELRVFKRLLDKSINQINKTTSLRVSYEQQKRGRSIVGFAFFITSPTPVKQPAPTNIRMTPGQRDKYARKLVDAMNGNREISDRLCQFPESRISAYALRVAVSNALSKPKVLASFLPLLKQVGFRQRKQIPRDEDGKPIIEDTISANFDF